MHSKNHIIYLFFLFQIKRRISVDSVVLVNEFRCPKKHRCIYIQDSSMNPIKYYTFELIDSFFTHLFNRNGVIQWLDSMIWISVNCIDGHSYTKFSYWNEDIFLEFVNSREWSWNELWILVDTHTSTANIFNSIISQFSSNEWENPMLI